MRPIAPHQERRVNLLPAFRPSDRRDYPATFLMELTQAHTALDFTAERDQALL
jgi:hypothetical protein